MNIASFQQLLSPSGQAVLAAATELQPSERSLLSCHQNLRKQFPEELVKAAVETVLLRLRARDKFSHAGSMYFTREALEQSSGEIIASNRARRFAGYSTVADFCCGIGGDSIGLTTHAQVFACDSDPLRLAMAEQNLLAYGRREKASFLAGDLLEREYPEIEAAFFDPDRRADGKRRLRIHEYQPSLNAVRAKLGAGFALGVKVAPGVPWSDLHEFDAEAEFISVAGELKECVLWFGELQTIGRRATVLPSGVTLFAEEPTPAREAGSPLAYIYDPDPAIVRSGLVANLGEMLDARPIDSEIAYLTAERLTATPFARAYAIDEAMPFHARRIGERLRAMNVGPLTMTKRGSAVDVDELRRKWKLRGTETRTVILTRMRDQPYAIIARAVTE